MLNFRESLQPGIPRIGLGIMYPAPGVVERIGPDWDWIWLDGQHGQMGYAEMLQLVRACDLIRRPAFVRLPGHEAGPIGQALDMGATGVIIPCVETAAQARELVHAAKFPPLGERSYGGRRPIDFCGRAYSATANEVTFLVVQIETPRGIEHIEEIASVSGVDALFLGLDDLMLRRGVPMDVPRSEDMIRSDMVIVADCCRRHGKISFSVGVGPDMLRLCLKMGFLMIVAGGDVPFLANSSRQAAAAARTTIQDFINPSPPGGLPGSHSASGS